MRGLQRAQVVINVGDQGDGAATAASFLEHRELMKVLRTGRDLLAEQRYAEAVGQLAQILEAPEDYFFQPDRDQPFFRSLKVEAQRLLGSMSAQGRQTYELQFGAAARRLLADGLARGDAATIAEVSRRFFHTAAGYEATHHLAAHQMDQGHPLAAALCLERLRETPAAAAQLEPQLSLELAACWFDAGMHAKAEAVLARLRTEGRFRQVYVGGRQVPLPEDDEDALAWLTDILGPRYAAGPSGAARWTMFRGAADRNASSIGGTPLLHARWTVPTSDDDPELETMLSDLADAYRDRQVAMLPSLHPLVVDDVVLMRTVGSLLAVDFRTGKRVWRASIDGTLDDLLEPSGSPRSRQTQQMFAGIEQRVWNNTAYGTMSSDGERVFAVDELVFRGDPANPQVIFAPNGQRRVLPGATEPFNRLAAYELKTEGKLAWELGGPKGPGELPLAGNYFLGAPLPLAGLLYALAEANGEIRLYALDAATGRPLWSQQLAVVETGVLQDPARMAIGVSPSYADGVLVCPTSAGAAVAVDLTTRSLLWGYRYSTQVDEATAGAANAPGLGGVVGNVRVWRASNNGQPPEGWSDATATIADGRVLLTPLESDELHVVDLVDGRLLWRAPRRDSLYVGGVVEGRVLLVGSSTLRCLSLSDGRGAWNTEPQAAEAIHAQHADQAELVAAEGAARDAQSAAEQEDDEFESLIELPSGSTPSGRGFLSGTRYYVPLSTAEVAVYDVPSGELLARSRSRDGTVPGNLVCYRDEVISQTPMRLASFRQLEPFGAAVAASLETNPDDPVALAHYGEILLHQRQVPEATAALRRSYQLRPDAVSRQLLVEALLETLRADFTRHRDVAAEIEALLERPEEGAQYLRVMATGLLAAGETTAAFEAYLKLADPALGPHELERVDAAHTIRRDRWVRAGLTSLRESADESERAVLDEIVDEQLEEALAGNDPQAMRRFLAYFGAHPQADQVRGQLAARLAAAGKALEAEFILRELSRSAAPQHAAAATARLALLLRDAASPDDAALVYEQLRTRFAEVPCLNEQTGRELYEALEDDHPIVRTLQDDSPWREGAVQKERLTNVNSTYRYYTAEFRGPRGPFFSDLSIELDQGRQTILARDGLGNVRWQVTLNDSNQRLQYGINPSVVHVRAWGHLLLVSLGHRLVAIDSLGESRHGAASILWSIELTESLPGQAINRAVHARQIALPWGERRNVVSDSYGRPVGALGPVCNSYACIQRGNDLLAIEPLTGEVLWQRGQIEPGSEVFGDEELLFVVPPTGEEALVLRAIDGELLGTRPVPAMNRRMALSGRRVLTWAVENYSIVVSLVDPWQKTEANTWDDTATWRRELSPGSKAALVGEELLGIVEPEGRFLVLDPATGAELINGRIEAEPQLTEIYLLASRRQVVLVTNHPWRNNQDGVFIRSVPGGFNNPLIHGQVYGFDRASGKRQWQATIEKQGLLLDQPRDLPVLVFASLIYERKAQGRPQTTTHSLIQCLDTRNGRMLHREKVPNHIGIFELAGDPSAQLVELRLQRNTIQMRLTDEPLPPEEAEADEIDEEMPDEPAVPGPPAAGGEGEKSP